jgi:hypothetical protein
MGKLTLLGVIVAAAIQAGSAQAQERIVPIVRSGEWEASMYQPSMIAPPTVCVVYNYVAGFILRVDAMTFQMRVTDHRWSLPADVSGPVVAKVGAFVLNEEIWGNTADTVHALLAERDLVQLLDAMDKGAVMTVKVGNATPFSVSLAGSTRVTNAFRTCANLPGADAGPGSNPFR